jgi:hypothetical protein
MISFVVHFSTAQDAVGYVILNAHGNVVGDFAGAPELQPGTYRIDDHGNVVRIQTAWHSPLDAQALAKKEGTQSLGA